MAPSSPNISRLKNIFALSIMCFTISAMKNVHVSSMSLRNRNENAGNYIEDLYLNKYSDLPSALASLDSETGFDQEDEGVDLNDDFIGIRDDSLQYDIPGEDQMTSWRNKRFLGTMARKNWFPRPFRRFIDGDNSGNDFTKYRHLTLLAYPEKKHIGSNSVTRVKLLSLPSSSFSSYLQQQLSRDDDEEDDDE